MFGINKEAGDNSERKKKSDKEDETQSQRSEADLDQARGAAATGLRASAGEHAIGVRVSGAKKIIEQGGIANQGGKDGASERGAAHAASIRVERPACGR